MADPNALYSYQGGEPQPLPHEIFYTESWGATTFRQGVETFTDEEITKAGYTGPFTRPSFNPDIETQTWNFEKQDWITAPIPDEFLLNRLRGDRDYKLSQSDWVVTRAKETDTDIPIAWKEYRQALRDLPANTTDLKNPIWPAQPE